MIGALKGVHAHSFHSPPSDYFSEGSGEDRVRVPNVAGLSPSAAAAELAAAGFGVSMGSSVASPYPKGTVARTSPGGGASVEPGTTVVIHVSRGEDRQGPAGGSPPRHRPPTKGPPRLPTTPPTPPPTFPPTDQVGNTAPPND
jgi:beta-lactam-binding protein with PASTA domain